MNVEELKQAIARREGFHIPGSVPQRLNNPGDLMYAGQVKAEPHSIHGSDGKVRVYAEFPTVADGWAALETQIRLDAKRGLTLQEFIRKYAPASDANDPASYLAFVMRALGLSDPNIRLAAVIA
jgi:hypothetical protein